MMNTNIDLPLTRITENLLATETPDIENEEA
jgi:hypothetical protein